MCTVDSWCVLLPTSASFCFCIPSCCLPTPLLPAPAPPPVHNSTLQGKGQHPHHRLVHNSTLQGKGQHPHHRLAHNGTLQGKGQHVEHTHAAGSVAAFIFMPAHSTNLSGTLMPLMSTT